MELIRIVGFFVAEPDPELSVRKTGFGVGGDAFLECGDAFFGEAFLECEEAFRGEEEADANERFRVTDLGDIAYLGDPDILGGDDAFFPAANVAARASLITCLARSRILSAAVSFCRSFTVLSNSRMSCARAGFPGWNS